jgi:hypothetical protein
MLLMIFRHKQKGTQQQAEGREESEALSLLVQSNPSERTKHVDTPNFFLAGSENHASQVPPFREPSWGIGLDTRKTIAVQCSLKSAT